MLRGNCFKMLGWAVGLPFIVATAAPAANAATTNASSAIPWNQIGARVGADYQGDGLAVTPTQSGARLHCVFQRLDGEATPEGLWLTSTVTNTVSDRFRVTAAEVERVTPCAPGHRAETSTLNLQLSILPRTGIVSLDGQAVRFKRPGLTEEYSVSMDGVRQDFVVTQKPAGQGQLKVQLAVSGARVEPALYGAQLVLEQSGRKLAYSRLRATDANGKELPARLETEPKSKINNQKSKMALAVVVDETDAVYPVRIDPTFSDANWVSLGGLPGTDRDVSVAVTDGSGNLYIGGDFTEVGNTIANYIAKWNGSGWSALGSGMSGGDESGPPYVGALVVSGSTLYAGGRFTTAGGNAAANIAQWNGSSWSALGSGISGGDQYGLSVLGLAVSGSTLYAGGGFTNAGGSAANGIAQWNGSTWSALGSGVSGGAPYGPAVYALAVSGSTLYAGGYFTNAGGSAANYIAQWNGSSWSALGSGVSGGAPYGPNVNALAVSGGTLYAGGTFTNAGGVAANNIARWNGSSWSALGSGIGGGGYTVVDALAVSGGTLYAGGGFTTAGGSAAYCIAQWNGSTWSALGSRVNGEVYALAVSGGTLYAGGFFPLVGGNEAIDIAQWNGSTWSTLGSEIIGLSGTVDALAVSGSTLYAGGYFTTAGGSAANYIAQWNGSSWSPLGSGLNDYVLALAVSGNTLYASGNFSMAGGTAVNGGIAQWNGSTWSAVGSGVYRVFALAVSGSTLYAGGGFTMASGSVANYIAQWDGSSWSALGSGMDSDVFALAVSGGTLFAGGDFTTAGGNAATNIAQWDGTSWSPLGSGIGDINSYVDALAVSGTNLYAGGWFTTAGGNAAANIAQWDGASWSPLGSGVGEINSYVDALAVSGTNLYAGGWFTTAGGTAATNIAQWKGSTWSALGSGMNDEVIALAASGGTLYAGGIFTTAGGKVSAYIAEAYLVAPPGGIVDSIVVPSSGIADLRCYGNPGLQFGVQRTTNLSPPLWTNVNSSPLIPAADGSFTFADTNAPPGAAYYRAFQY